MHHKTKYLKLALAIAASLIFSLRTDAQTPQERHARIRSAMDSGDVKSAMVELMALRNSSPALFAVNNYDYLLARLQEKTADAAGASVNYQSVVKRNSALSQYALWHLAQVARSTGDLTLERERLRHLIATSPAGLLRNAAMLRLGESFFESKDYAGAVAALRPLDDASKGKSLAREALALMGDALLKAGKGDEARNVFRRVVMQMPDASRPDDFALSAVRGLDQLDSENAGSTQAKTAQLVQSEHLLRASVYQFNRDFEAARLHYLAIIERYPQSPSVANALYQLGRGFYLQNRYDESLKYFKRAVDQTSDNASARDALGFSAAAYNRLKRTDDALATYQRYIERFPDAPNPERPFLNIIDALHEAGRHSEALNWVEQTRTRFKNQMGEALALFAQTRIHLAQNAWASVIADTNELGKLSDLGGVRVPGGTTLSEITFLRAYALERLGRPDEAVSEYLSIPDGRNEYYGKRATQRLLAMGADARTRPLIEARATALRTAAQKAINNGQADQGRKLAQDALRLTGDEGLKNETLALVMRAYDALPAYKLPSFNLLPLGRQQVITTDPNGNKSPALTEGSSSTQVLAEELFFLGLYDEAVLEFAEQAPAKNGSNKNLPAQATAAAEKAAPVSSQADLDYSLAVYALRGGLANRAVRFGEQVWKPVSQDYVLELAPRALVDLLYPLPYRESLLKHAPSRAVDPRLVVSIARQESRFQPDAKSIAAARGFMQFIPATANDIATQLELHDFRQDHLYNPDTAILFGSQYVANLFKLVPPQPQAVLAAYDAGPHNVARWVARSQSNEADQYVTELGFSETKDYVHKVTTNFWIYQQLYDEKLNRK